MGKTPDMPDAPNPYQTAQAQADVNRVNTYTPYGSAQYGHVGADGQWAEGMAGRGDQAALRVVESPFQEQLREGMEAGALDLQSVLLGDGVSLPDRATPQSTDQIAQQFYDNNVGLLSENFERDQMRTEGRLQNRGLPVGSEAFGDGMTPVLDAQSGALANLAAQAQQFAAGEQSRQYGLDRDARSTALGEYMTAISGEQFTPSPLINMPNVPQIDLAGMINSNYQAQMQQAQIEQAGQNQTFGLLGGLLGGLF